MVFIGRKTLKSERARMQQINAFFSRVALVCLVLYGLFLSLVWLSERALWRITTITVAGVHATSPEEVRVLAQEFGGTHLLFWIRRDNAMLFPRARFLSELTRRYPRIADARVDTPTRTTLVVNVREYVPTYLLCRVNEKGQEAETFSEDRTIELPDGEGSTTFDLPVYPEQDPSSLPTIIGDCYFSDGDGYIFSSAPEYVGHPFLTIIAATTTPNSEWANPVGTALFDRTTKEKISRFITQLDGLALHTHTVILRGDGDVEFDTNAPWTILWSLSLDPLESTRDLAIVLGTLLDPASPHRDLHRVDLRFGNKVFYR